MTARRVATAQREGAQQTVAPQAAPPVSSAPVSNAEISWGALGCPQNTGVYCAGEGARSVQIRVRRIHIIAAEDDPDALFTVVVHRPPLGPPEFMLGHRVA